MLKVARTCLVLLLVGASWAGAENRALIVGVGQYRQPGANLPGIEKDVALMTEAARRMGFADSQIKVLMDADATLENIDHAFATWLVDGVTAKDRVLFYFSGHGSFIPDTSGDEADGTDEVLLPHDFRVGRGTLENTLVDDDLGVMLDRIPTRNVYVFLDACHSGTATRGLGDGEYVAKSFDYPGMPVPKPVAGATRGLTPMRDATAETHVVLTAATEQERAQASKRGSLFTLAVLDAVSRAAEESRPLTPKDVRESADKFISTVLAIRPALIHHPTAYGDSALLSKNLLEGPRAAPAPAAPVAPAPATATNAAPAPAVKPDASRPAPAAHQPPPSQPPAPKPPAPAAPPPPAATAASAAGTGAVGTVWSQLESVAKRANYPVKVTPHKTAFHVGEQLVIDVDVAADGYLNVLDVGAGDGTAVVLYPNKYHPDNAVKAGQKLTIPPAGAAYSLPAGLPAGQGEQQQLIVVLHTKQKLSAYEAGAGDGFLRALDGPATRSFSVVAAQPDAGGFGAGRTIVVIKR